MLLYCIFPTLGSYLIASTTYLLFRLYIFSVLIFGTTFGISSQAYKALSHKHFQQPYLIQHLFDLYTPKTETWVFSSNPHFYSHNEGEKVLVSWKWLWEGVQVSQIPSLVPCGPLLQNCNSIFSFPRLTLPSFSDPLNCNQSLL